MYKLARCRQGHAEEEERGKKKEIIKPGVSMPGAWTAGVRTRPKAVRVIRERERRDK